ncbi:MAG: nicotinate-nucleotide adenylyltransferase [Pseudohongiellaceae bacterium]
MTSRLGVYGGMFDPVHNGHIDAARYAVSLLNLDRLLLIPCATPNHRDPATASAEHRLRMLAMAIADYRKLAADAREIEREGVSYAVDTLAELRDEGDYQQLVFVMGLDAFNTLPQWHQWQRILELSHVLVLNRDGARLDDQAATATGLASRSVDTPEELFAEDRGSIYVAEDFDYGLSSTQVRRSLRANERTDNMLDEKVRLYIEDHRLYR